MQHGQAVSDHNRHVMYDSGIAGPAPDKGNDPQQWWKETGQMERKEGVDGGGRRLLVRGGVRISGLDGGRMDKGKKRRRR